MYRDTDDLLTTKRKHLARTHTQSVQNVLGKECKARVDLAFVMDGSKGVGAQNFKQSMKFIKDIIDSFDVSHGNTHVALTVCAETPHIVFDFKAFSDHKAIMRAIQSVKYPKGQLFAGGCLNSIKTAIFSNSGRHGVPKLLYFITGDSSRDHVALPSRELRDMGVQAFSLGLGNSYNARELKEVATSPYSDHVMATRYEILRLLRPLVTAQLCRGSGGKLVDRKHTVEDEKTASGSPSNEDTPTVIEHKASPPEVKVVPTVTKEKRPKRKDPANGILPIQKKHLTQEKPTHVFAKNLPRRKSAKKGTQGIHLLRKHDKGRKIRQVKHRVKPKFWKIGREMPRGPVKKTRAKNPLPRGPAKKVIAERPLPQRKRTKKNFAQMPLLQRGPVNKIIAEGPLAERDSAKKIAAESSLNKREPVKKIIAEKPLQECEPVKKIIAERPLPQRETAQKIIGERPPLQRERAKKIIAERPIAEREAIKKIVAKRPLPQRETGKKIITEWPLPEREPVKKVIAEKPQPEGEPTKKIIAAARPLLQREPAIVAEKPLPQRKPAQKIIAEKPHPKREPTKKIIAAARPLPQREPEKKGIAERPLPQRRPAQKVIAKKPQPGRKPTKKIIAAERPLPQREPANKFIAERPLPQRKPAQKGISERPPSQSEPVKKVIAEKPLPERESTKKIIAAAKPLPQREPVKKIITERPVPKRVLEKKIRFTKDLARRHSKKKKASEKLAALRRAALKADIRKKLHLLLEKLSGKYKSEDAVYRSIVYNVNGHVGDSTCRDHHTVLCKKWMKEGLCDKAEKQSGIDPTTVQRVCPLSCVRCYA